MRVLLANPRGFCAGVDRAIAIVERALELFAAPIYVRHEVVHNRFVVEGLKARGAIFVEELAEVPHGAIVIFSAHGVAQSVREEAKLRGLQVFDATCPLVTKVHMEVARASRKNAEVVLIGHAGHPEVNGTMGQYASTQGAIYLIEKVEDVEKLQIKQPDDLYFVSQTTLSIDETKSIVAALRARFANIQGPHKDDICYATQNRQDAVRELALHSDVVIVVGSKNSSNSNRLRELAQKMGVPAYLVDQAQDIDASWLQGCAVVGISAGASAPQQLVELIIDKIKSLGATSVEELSGIEEKMVFELPKELQIKQLD
ncbi:MAG: 4-hydroxy-3-methylbut-2-enyl diphosphate reductase [Vibrionaceae bacterium]